MSEPDSPTKGSSPPVGGSPDNAREVRTSDAGATLDAGSSAAADGKDEKTERKLIGPYRLVRKLGEGGMGQVWLAEQTLLSSA